MSDLLPESWRVEEMNAQSPSQRGGPRCGLVMDILIWLECFATLASVITSKRPEKAPYLFAYARMIIRARRNIKGAKVRQPRVGSHPLGNRLNQSYNHAVYLINQWPTNVDTHIVHICSMCCQGPHPASQCSRPCCILMALPPQTVTPRITPRL